MAEATAILAFGLLVLWLGNRERAIFYPLLVAFGTRVLASAVNLYVIQFPAHRWGDATTFERYAWGLASLEWEPFVNALEIGDPYFTYGWIVGLFYRTVGHAELASHVLNGFLGTLVVFYIFKTARILWNESTAVRAAWIAAGFPAFLHYHTVLLREVWVALGFTLSVYFLAVYFYKRQLFLYAALSVVAMGGATIFHGGMAAGVAGLLLVFFWRLMQLWKDLIVWKKGVSKAELGNTSLLVVLAAPLLLYGVMSGVDINKLGDLRRLTSPETFLTVTAETAQSRHHGGAKYPSALSITRPTDVIWKTVPRAIYFLFSPFPWDVTKPVHAVALLDSFIYITLFYLMVKNWKNVHRRKTLFFIIVTIPIIIAFSFGASNFGAAMRHRAKIASLIICLVPYFSGQEIKQL